MMDLDEAIARANAALEAGADVAFVEAVQSVEEAAAVPKRVRGPCLLNIVPGGRTPVGDVREAEAMGYRIAILPGLMLQAAIVAGDAALAQLKATGRAPAATQDVAQTFRRFGADEWDALRARFSAGARATHGDAASGEGAR
jgi:2-methylisocitrate lyase-like PEP mutase family enzyme